MGAKRLKQEQCDWVIEYESFEDPDYNPSNPTYSSAKKRKTNKRNASQSESKATDSSEKSSNVELKRKAVSADLYNNNSAQISALVEAERTLASLQNDIPHFVKRMLPSNVEGGFWMHIPRAFCNRYLPNHDSTIVLMDELGNECETTFILARNGLSAGWRTFSISHGLKRGEILIFKLMAPCKIKVHIVRVPGPEDLSAATAIMILSGSHIEEDDVLGEKCEWKLKMLLKCVPLPLNISSPLKNRKKCIKPGCRLCLQR